MSGLFSTIGEEEIFKNELKDFIDNNNISLYEKVIEAINDENNEGEHVCILFYAEKIMQEVGFIAKDSEPEISIVDCDMWGNTYSLHDISYVLTCLAIGLVNNGVLKLREKLRRRTTNDKFGPSLEEIQARDDERKALEDKVVKVIDIRNIYKDIENKMITDFVSFNDYMRNKNNLMRQFTQMRFDLFAKWNTRRINKRVRVYDDEEKEEENNNDIVKLRNKANDIRSNRMGRSKITGNVNTSLSTSTSVSNSSNTISTTINSNANASLSTSSSVRNSSNTISTTIYDKTNSSTTGYHSAYSTLSSSYPQPANRHVLGINHVHDTNSQNYGYGNNSMSSGLSNINVGIDIGLNASNVLGGNKGGVSIMSGIRGNGYSLVGNSSGGIDGGMLTEIGNNNSMEGNRWDSNNDEDDNLVCDTPDCFDNIDTIQICEQCNVSYCDKCFENHKNQDGVCANET